MHRQQKGVELRQVIMVNDIVSVNLPSFEGFSIRILGIVFHGTRYPRNRNVFAKPDVCFHLFFSYLKTGFGRSYRVVDDY